MTRLELSTPGSVKTTRLLTKMTPEKVLEGIKKCLDYTGDSYMWMNDDENSVFTILPKKMLQESIIHIEEENNG